MKIGEPIGQNKRHGFNVFARFAYTSARMRKRTFLFHAHMANGDWGTCVYICRSRKSVGRTCDGLQIGTKEEIWILDSTQGKGKIAIVRRLEGTSQRVGS